MGNIGYTGDFTEHVQLVLEVEEWIRLYQLGKSESGQEKERK